VPLDELELAGRGVEARPQEERLGEHEQRDDERDLARQPRARLVVAGRVVPARRQHEQQQGAGDRQGDERRENRKRHQVHK
jgi:hypothetical protein